MVGLARLVLHRLTYSFCPHLNPSAHHRCPTCNKCKTQIQNPKMHYLNADEKTHIKTDVNWKRDIKGECVKCFGSGNLELCIVIFE